MEKDKEQKKEGKVKIGKKTLRNFVILVVIILAVVLAVLLFSGPSTSFTYQGVKFDIVKYCDSGPPCLTLYRTTLPVKNNGTDFFVTTISQKTNDYFFDLTNDPRTLNVPFNGTLIINKETVFNSHQVDSCKSGTAGPNFQRFYYRLGVHVFGNESFTCDPLGRYTLITVKPGNQTSIEQVGLACYNINIKNCEIYQGMEEFMLQTFIEINNAFANQSS